MKASHGHKSSKLGFIEACMANEPRATNGSPVIRAKKLLEAIINYAKVIK
jgi:hypothetical protein